MNEIQLPNKNFVWRGGWKLMSKKFELFKHAHLEHRKRVKRLKSGRENLFTKSSLII